MGHVWGTKPKQMIHHSTKLNRRAPQGRGRFEQRMTAAEKKLLGVLSKPGRYLSTEQERKLEYLIRKDYNERTKKESDKHRS